MRIEPADRVKQLPPYLFAQLEMRVSEMKARGETVYDLSIGDPDLPTPPEIVQVMQQAASDSTNQGYSTSRGERFFREAVSEWYKTRFGITLSESSEVCALIGTKEGIANVARAFVNPGDRILVPDPSYPVYANGAAILSGGEPVFFPLLESDHFLPDLGSLNTDAKMMYLNYPNNPTGAVADIDFLKAAVDFARDNEIILCYDNAYSELVFGEKGASSILEVSGAMECCIEFNSCSKTFNMTGSRLGFAAGAEDIISAMAKVKSQVDSGPVPYIQRAGAFALSLYEDENPPKMVRNSIDIYERRMRALAAGLNEAGIPCKPSPATFYLWVNVQGSSIEFANKLLEKGIVVTPGIGFGNHGEGYVRFALTKDEEIIARVIEKLKT